MSEPAVDPTIVVIARRIVAGSVTPYDGAREIWTRLADDGEPYPEELAIFVGLASEWQDHEQHRSQYEHEIRQEARALVARAAAGGGG